ncbi:MAG: hypothetical protein J6S13_01340 [Clostridia bacterium]|nr:hypothetical protein [Clostridia bacterium]
MTGKEIISKSLMLLGLQDSTGNTSDARFLALSKNALCFVLADIFSRLGQDFEELKSLDVQIDLPRQVLYDCVPYGVAAFVAEGVGDGDKQQYFSAIYNLKRGSVVPNGDIGDIIPAP